MSVPGQAPAPPAADSGQPPAQTPGAAPAPQDDPLGLAGAVAQIPEHLREPVQTALQHVTQPLTERLSGLQPVEPFLEQLNPLLQPVNEEGQPDPNGEPPISGLLALYQLFSDEGRIEELEDWWETVGESMGFFGDDGEDGQGAGLEASGTDAGAGELDLGTLDPAVRGVVEGLQRNVQELTAQLGEFRTEQETSRAEQQRAEAVNAEAERIVTSITGLMRQHHIPGHDDQNPLQTQAGRDIMRIIGGYGGDPQAVEKGFADFLRLAGAGEAQPLVDAGEQLSGIDALRQQLAGGGAGGRSGGPGPALGDGHAAHEPEAVRSFDHAKELAVQRFRQAGHFQQQ